MFRFFVEQKEGDAFILPKETLHHIKVARVSEEHFICTYKEKFYVCKLEGNLAVIENELNENHEHDGEVVIAASIIDTKRFELLIQKAAELGATKLIPVISKNVSKKISGDITKKVERWNIIALNASEQSFRNKPLIVKHPQKLFEIMDINISNKFIAHEKKEAQVPTSFPANSLFLVGPEGGFTDQEVQEAVKNDFQVVSLGKRILRAETASIMMLSKII